MVMNKSTDKRIKYISEDAIYFVDLSGQMDEGKLADISEALRDSITSNIKSSKTIKFLFDFRNVQWDSEATHMKSRKISGKYLQDVLRGRNYFSAILNNQLEGKSSENEFFFSQEEKALEWLRKK